MKSDQSMKPLHAMGLPVALAVLAVSALSTAQVLPDSTASANERPPTVEESISRPTIRAVRVANSGIRLDGILDESDWTRAPSASGFTQHEPLNGAASTERTVIKVVYDDRAIYVAVRAYDTEPDKIVANMSRRDDECPADWVYIAFDSYNDKRTAFEFSVNAAGVKLDAFWFDCVERDMNWNAVWNVATNIDDEGWTVEYCIPFSQIRFAENGGAHSWGFQVFRQINRKNEVACWAPVPREDNQFIAHFGRLEGIENLPRFKRLEILPYAVASVNNYGDPDAEDPFRNALRGDGRLGADIKYGVTSNLTLDMTINPDFGQVEQDPSEFNLTAYESYFEEKRPFFIEGSNTFQYPLMFGDGDMERLFYSRRIGRSPQFYALDTEWWPDMDRWTDTDDFYENSPQFTTILGAAKLTGRTSNGWSIGVLEALTDKEEAEVSTPSGQRFGVAVEPMTNYLVGRTVKDFNDGRSTLGIMATSVVREIPSDDLAFLNRSAFTGGVDLSHRWRNDDYQIIAKVFGSHVRGSEEAMIELQESSARYFQRPDADHVELDPTATSLSGYGGVLWGGKFGGKPWRFGIGGITRSPGFESNDIGYLRDADINLGVFWGQYVRFEPVGAFQQFNCNTNIWYGWNYGGEVYGKGGNVNGWMQFRNYWEAYGGVSGDLEALSTRHLRGGSSIIEPAQLYSWYGFFSDRRKKISFGFEGNYYMAFAGGTYSTSYSPMMTIRPSGRFDLSLYPGYTISENDMQYVDEIDGHHVLGHLDMRVLTLTARFNYTVTPDMTIQFYGMPFVTAGAYSDYREAVAPHASDYDDRFAPFDYLAHADNPDFNFKQFRSNLVFRWEFNPGSALYLVWSRGATDYEEEYGKFSPGRDLDQLFSTPGDNTFLIKINKWFSL
jgi:hypothetical protein